MTHIGNKIRVLREQRDMSKPELADVLGVTVPAIHHIERGFRKPSLPLLIKMADFFGESVEDLARISAEDDAAIAIPTP